MAGVSAFWIKGPLRLGSHGDSVKVLQRLLAARAPHGGMVVDGRFGLKTHKAVRAFQRSAKLKVDGVVGPRTAEALDAAYTLARIPNVLTRHPKTKPLRPGQVQTALELIVATLQPRLHDFWALLRAEIPKSGAVPKAIALAEENFDDVIMPALDNRLADWPKREYPDGLADSFRMDMLTIATYVLEYVGVVLKENGGDTSALIARFEKLDYEALVRVLRALEEGREDANAAAFDVQQVMMRAVA
ncbi:hypothetical protein sos41_28700 [Alphaproteobacteria bacterium SO-S41]|nr:hypothetical protein sos41_28700 [Alphaproteobacteria bacterium SO-S41]